MEILNKIENTELRAEIKTELEKYIKTKEESIGKTINDRFNSLADSIIEKDLKPILGDRLPTETKFGDYTKRAITEKINSYETQIKTLNEKIKTGVNDEQVKQQITELENKAQTISKLYAEKEAEILQVKSEAERMLLEYKINSAKQLQMPKLAEEGEAMYKTIVIRQNFDKELETNWELSINQNNELICRNKANFIEKKYSDFAKEFCKDVLFENKQQATFNPAKPAKTDKLIIPEGMPPQEQDKLIISYIREVHGVTDVKSRKFMELYQNILAKKQ